ncbi:MAG: ribosome small subunit-dependent GTPase A [Clostridia bacterium]|nr:ribosome small subunit-dependent GTPase A [Clostridia bacterium]
MEKIKGLVTKVYSDKYTVSINGGKVDCIARGLFKLKKSKPLVGDIVEIKDNVIEKIYPRKNEFIRPPIANVEQLVIVIATTNPAPDLLLLDKQLIMAKKNDVDPIICVNKIDLKDDYDEIVDVYQDLGYQVITTNAKEGIGVEKLALILQNKITAFTGNSGVGKSALTNSIFKDEISEEGETSKKLEKGKHTTKFVELYEIAPNSYIADTPGFSTYELKDINYRELDRYFSEFIPHIQDCKYRGCTHIKEEKCAIKKAVERRLISKGRYERYCTLYEKLKGENKW